MHSTQHLSRVAAHFEGSGGFSEHQEDFHRPRGWPGDHVGSRYTLGHAQNLTIFDIFDGLHAFRHLPRVTTPFEGSGRLGPP